LLGNDAAPATSLRVLVRACRRAWLLLSGAARGGTTMYYGLGGIILLIVLILVLTGRL
jgi:hypothetical protein